VIYSSTVLKRFNDNCPGALGKMIDGEPYDREIFQAGIAAHACLEEITNKKAVDLPDQAKVCDAVCEELITKGRAYNKIPEPPMAPQSAFAGRDIVIEYLLWNDLPAPEQVWSAEGGYGMTADGKACGYYEDAVRFRAVIDLVYQDIVGDEDYAADVIVVRDYKSAWPTGEADLDTLQRKGQAVLVWKQHCQGKDSKFSVIRQEAVNLRTGVPYKRDIQLDEEGIEMLLRWQKDILTTCNAADATREYRPGAGCLTCDYTLSCDMCLDAYKGDGSEPAVQYAALEAVRSDLGKVLRAKTREQAIEIDGGFVGYERKVKQVPVENANQLLTDQWTMDDTDEHPELTGILKALKLTGANVENVLKVLYPGRGSDGKENMETRRTLLEDLLKDKPESRFGVFK